jgi:predicted  nucleic acid-binding Zn-ribbon protein
VIEGKDPVIILPQDEFDAMTEEITHLRNDLHDLRIAYAKLKTEFDSINNGIA